MALSADQRLRCLERLGLRQWVPRRPLALAACVTDSPSAESTPLPVIAPPVIEPPVIDPPVADTPVVEAPPPESPTLRWERLRTQVAECTACALSEGRTQTVFGVGDPNGPWLFIGEGPGAEEDRRGEPFVGPAGQLLDAMLSALGLHRGEGVYIANVVKCRPPGNRDPRPEERAACRRWLEAQIALIQPRIVVALGKVAAQSLLGSDETMARLRGREHRLSGHEIPLVATYHPAYLLRSPAEKGKAWQDLLLARRLLTARR